MKRLILASLLLAAPTQAAPLANATETRPMTAETALPPETETSVEFSGIRFPARLTRPAGAPVGAVLIIPGSLNCDVDGNFNTWNVRSNVYADLARQLAARGWIVLRYAKAGPGTGAEVTDLAASAVHADFMTRVDVAHVALEQLRRELPAGTPLIVAGHSEGALVGSLLAGGPDAAHISGLVSLSGPALRLLDIMRAQVLAMPMPGTMDNYDRALGLIRSGQPLTPDLAADPRTGMLFSMGPMAWTFLKTEDAVFPPAAIAAVDRPVLLVQGGRDLSVTPEQVDALLAARKGLPTEVARFPELQHMYKRAPEGLDGMASFSLGGENDPAVADAIDVWGRKLES